MTLREFLSLPYYTEGGKTYSAREAICTLVNAYVRAGWHKGGKRGQVGILFFGTLAVLTPDHEITPDKVESCIDISLCQFFTFGSRDDLKTTDEVMAVWMPTGSACAFEPRALSGTLERTDSI